MKDIFLVDADDTVLDFHGVAAVALKDSFLHFNLPWQDDMMQIYQSFNTKLWEALERKELSRDELMDTRFHRFFAYMGYTNTDADAFNKYYLHSTATKPAYIEGAKELLAKLTELGKVYIVTNGTAWVQKSRFSITKLYDYASGVFVSAEIGYDKPDSRFTDYVINHIDGFDKTRAVWIGDSLSADIKAANEANICSIWFNPHKKPITNGAKPDYAVDKLDKILDILQKIE